MNWKKTMKERQHGKRKRNPAVKETQKEQKIDLSVSAGIKGCKWV
jgi:hypothetical protein